MRACICGRQENSTTTAALFYVDRNMLPAILKNYAGAQVVLKHHKSIIIEFLHSPTFLHSFPKK